MLTQDTSITEFMDTLDTDAFSFTRYMHLPKFYVKRCFADATRDADAMPLLFLDDLRPEFNGLEFVH